MMFESEQAELDAGWMRQALAAAEEAQGLEEVPVGTCIVSGETLLAVAGNRTRTDCDPTAHAEIQAMRAAAAKVGNYRLTGATLYVTLEPCDMCVGAMFHARIAKAVYGAKDPKKLVLKNQVRIEGGVMAEECGAILSSFFAARR